MSEPRTEAGKRLHEAVEGMESVSVEWAPAHSAPYVSKYIVLPVVDIWIARIESEAAATALEAAAERVDSLPLGHAFHEGGPCGPSRGEPCAITAHWHQTYKRAAALATIRASKETP